MVYLVVCTLVLIMAALALVIRRRMRDRVLAVPFLALFLMELITIWPATIVSYAGGTSTDPFLYLLVLATTLSLLLGYSSGVALFKTPRGQAYAFHARPVVAPPRGALLAIWLVTFAVLMAASIYTANGIPPYWKSLLAGPSDMLATMVRESRLDATKGHYFGGEYRGQGIVKTLMQVAPAFLIASAAFGYAMKRTPLRLAMFLGSIGWGVLFAMSIGSRAPAVYVLLVSLIISAFLWKLRVKHISGAVAAFFIATLFMSVAMPRYYSSYAEAGLSYVPRGVAAVIERVSLANAGNSVLAVESGRLGLVERTLAEEHIDKILRLLPNSRGSLPLAADLTALRRGNVNTTTFTTPTWLASTYLDFGLGGSAAVYFILGLLVAFAEKHIFAQRKTLMGVSIAAVLTLATAMAIVSSPLSLLPLGVILTLYVVLCGTILRLIGLWNRRRGAARSQLRRPEAQRFSAP
jgi:predicted small integral membrane protein